MRDTYERAPGAKASRMGSPFVSYGVLSRCWASAASWVRRDATSLVGCLAGSSDSFLYVQILGSSEQLLQAWSRSEFLTHVLADGGPVEVLDRRCPKSKRIRCPDGNVLYLHFVTASYLWPSDACDVSRATEELTLTFYSMLMDFELIFKWSCVASG